MASTGAAIRAPHARRLELAAAAGCAAAIAVLGIVLERLQVSTNAALIAAVAFALAIPLVARATVGAFDLLDPILVATLCFLVMYVLRPAALLAEGRQHVFKGYDVTDRLTWALVLVVCGVIAFQVGASLPLARTIASRLPAPRDRFDVHATVTFAFGLAVVATVLFSLFLMQAGGIPALLSMLEGRSSTQIQYFTHSTAYFWAAPQLFWPASLLLFAMGIGERRRGYVVWSFVLMLPLALFAGGQGARIILLPLLAAPAVYYMLARDKRPRLPVALLAGYLFFTLGIAYFRETRVADDDTSRVTELRTALVHPRREYDDLVFGGVDNDMFESLAVETYVVPSRLPIRPLEFVYRTAAKPIPRVLWPGKPLEPEQLLTHTLYPREVTRASSSSGLVGNLFQFGGLPGVVLGMLLIGACTRVPWEYFRRFRRSGTAQLLLTSFIMFVPILLRGAIGETLAMALFAFGPLIVAARFCQHAEDVR